MARHKWERQHPSGERCRCCLVRRHLHLPVAGPRASWFYVWQDGRIDQAPADHAVPPCPGAPESKKEER